MHPYHAWPFLSAPAHPLLSALWELFAHGSLGLLVVWPIVRRSERWRLFGALGFIGGFALDIDHAIAAESLSPRAMEDLGGRPDTHSLAFALLLALVGLLLTRRLLIGWCVLALIVGHLLFDAAGGGVSWLFPLKAPDSIPWLACPIGVGLLFAISALLAPRERSAPDANPVDKHRGREVRGGVG
jgi:hypothetical protein